MTQKLYRYDLDCGRQGDVTGTFVADDAVIAAAMGKRAYFGEILGKHSDVRADLEEDQLTVLTEDPKFIALYEEIIGSSGRNPLDYIRKDD